MLSPDVRPWLRFLSVARPDFDPRSSGTVLCLDPGHTTGFAVFSAGTLEVAGEWSTESPATLAEQIERINEDVYSLDRIVFEEYRVRGNKVREHIGSEVLTIQHVGAIRVTGDRLGLALSKQSAGMAKGFATDAKLRRWGLYQRGKRHANDAVRHGCYYLLFAAGRKDPRRRET